MNFSFFGLPLGVFVMILSTHIGTCYSGFPSEDFISWSDLSMDNYLGKLNLNDGVQGQVIVVAKDGTGDSTTVQGAVDLVPDGNMERVKIFILPGIYREKVVVPISKPFISFLGNRSTETVISWNSKASDRGFDGQVIGTLASATVAIESAYFCARGITFENTSPSALPGAKGMQAVALRVSGDKAMFLRSRILGSQDTLFDQRGRHYYYKCYIQGSIDFIFGNARSLYQGCTLHAIAASFGAVAASQRNSPSENSGFSFLKCKLTGTGMIYLGRAWGRYARVVYSFCNLDGIIIPQGWSDWGDPSRQGTVWFGEYKCTGEGADFAERVPWAKSLSNKEAKPFLNKDYIDGYQWLRI